MNIYERALNSWGRDTQMLQVIEEMSELTKEILKNVNRQKDNMAEIVEETADVEIMLEQLKCCYGIAQDVENYKAQKLLKIEKRLDEWEKRNKDSCK